MKKALFLVFTLLLVSLGHTHAQHIERYSDHAITPDWAKTAFNAMLAGQIISGNADGTLKPNHPINRAELCKILVKATKKPLVTPTKNTFPDVLPEHWFYPYVETAYSLGWIKGYPDGTFKPGNNINRAEVAKLITKSFILNVGISDSKDWYAPFVESLETYGVLPFNTKVYNFDPSRTPTRAEIFEQIYRTIRADSNFITENQGNPGLIKTTPKDPYEITGNFTIKLAVSENSGSLDMKRPEYQPRKISVNSGDKSQSVFQLELVARNAPVEIAEIQLRRIGNGTIKDFGHMWMEINGVPVTDKFIAQEDLVTFQFRTPQSFPVNQLRTLKLVSDIATSAKSGHSHRFVLYLPDWLNANTNEKIGLFPFGGSDIEIK